MTRPEATPALSRPREGDVSGRRRDSERARAIAELSHALAASIDDVQVVLDGVVGLVSDFLGDTAVIRLLEPGAGTAAVVAIGDSDETIRTMMRAMVTAAPRSLHELAPWATAVREAHTVALTDGELRAATSALPVGVRGAIRDVGVTSALICPLRTGGGVIGTLALWRRGDRPEHSDRDQAFAQELADRAALAIDNARLVERLRAEVEERKRNEESMQLTTELLQRAEEQRRVLLSNLLSAEEEQRRRIAVDIHDDSIQAMAAISLRLQVLRRHASTPELAERITEIEDTVLASIMRLRQLLFQLDAPSVDDGGLARALSRYLEEVFPEPSPTTTFRSRLITDPPVQTCTLLYRIAQEAINNVRKHARATTVTVTLSPLDDGVLATIQDDGIGFNLDEVGKRSLPGHLGLRSMLERASVAEGSLTIESGRGAGTTLRLWLPIPAPLADI